MDFGDELLVGLVRGFAFLRRTGAIVVDIMGMISGRADSVRGEPNAPVAGRPPNKGEAMFAASERRP